MKKNSHPILYPIISGVILFLLGRYAAPLLLPVEEFVIGLLTAITNEVGKAIIFPFAALGGVSIFFALYYKFKGWKYWLMIGIAVISFALCFGILFTPGPWGPKPG